MRLASQKNAIAQMKYVSAVNRVETNVYVTYITVTMSGIMRPPRIENSLTYIRKVKRRFKW